MSAEKTKGTITTDPEIAALTKIGRILAELDDEARKRIVEYINRKYGNNEKPT